jgi:hypothetical protein
MHWNRVSFHKMYLFIYRTDMFRLFPSHHQGACYMAQRKNILYVFQDTIIYINILQMHTPLHRYVHKHLISNLLLCLHNINCIT